MLEKSATKKPKPHYINPLLLSEYLFNVEESFFFHKIKIFIMQRPKTSTKSGLWVFGHIKLFYPLSLGIFIALCSSFAPFETASGNPVGGNVTHGSATIKNTGNILTINQGTDSLIMGWNSFSIALGETTVFMQPSRSSLALNRVYGGTASMIAGTLEANGGVILINPAGITVSRSGVVNVNTFIGSTHDITDSEFLSGRALTFKGNSASSIENYGTIHAESGDVILIARNIRNEGVLSASKGKVGLASADEVLYQPEADERLLIKSPNAIDGSIHAGGLIQAAAAEIKAAGNPYAVAINLDGVIQVRGNLGSGEKPKVVVSAKHGSIQMKNSSKIDAGNDSKGGMVVVQAAENLDIAGTIEATSANGTGGGFSCLVTAFILPHPPSRMLQGLWVEGKSLLVVITKEGTTLPSITRVIHCPRLPSFR